MFCSKRVLGLLGHYTAVSEAATMSFFDKNSSTFISAFRHMNKQDGTEFQPKLNTDVDLTGLLAPCTNGSTKTEHHQQPPMVCSGLRQVCMLGCEKRFQEKQRMKF